MAKQIPNLLSIIRIVAALFLPFINNKIFIFLYAFCGLTDVLDGYIARKFGFQTELGAKLDSLGDFFFWTVVLPLLILRTSIFSLPVIVGTSVIALVRLVNILVTKVKFKQWGLLHSLGNKITGVLLYCACLAAFIFDDLHIYAWGVFAPALIFSIEETIILIKSNKYNPNPQGFFRRMQ